MGFLLRFSMSLADARHAEFLPGLTKKSMRATHLRPVALGLELASHVRHTMAEAEFFSPSRLGLLGFVYCASMRQDIFRKPDNDMDLASACDAGATDTR
jgi:hypothetical protein